MGAIGGSYAWPGLTIASDGEFVQLRLEAESSPDVSAVRYLRDITVDVSVAHFEQAVERFIDAVEARLVVRVPEERELSELRDELRAERGDVRTATVCKLQALAGVEPGSASEDWIRTTQALMARTGASAVEEILAVAPELQGGLAGADVVISALRNSQTTVELKWAASTRAPMFANELPWQRGVRVARELRKRMSILSGPLAKDAFEQLIGARLPLPRSAWTGRGQLLGGYRNGITNGHTAVLVTKDREDSQRFYLARLIGAACASPSEEHFLAVSDAFTAFQKFERSFAQELLCPWQELDVFTSEFGTDDDGIAAAAEQFVVSERLVLSTLVSHGKISRNRLQV